jgi:hypothetical protein
MLRYFSKHSENLNLIWIHNIKNVLWTRCHCSGLYNLQRFKLNIFFIFYQLRKHIYVFNEKKKRNQKSVKNVISFWNKTLKMLIYIRFDLSCPTPLSVCLYHICTNQMHMTNICYTSYGIAVRNVYTTKLYEKLCTDNSCGELNFQYLQQYSIKLVSTITEFIK